MRAVASLSCEESCKVVAANCYAPTQYAPSRLDIYGMPQTHVSSYVKKLLKCFLVEGG